MRLWRLSGRDVSPVVGFILPDQPCGVGWAVDLISTLCRKFLSNCTIDKAFVSHLWTFHSRTTVPPILLAHPMP